MKARCRFLVVVKYNDGRDVEPEKMIRWKRELDRRFGGYRILDPQEGSWHGQIEFTHEIEVAVNPRRVPEVRKFVLEIGKELGQSAMYFEATNPSIEILNVETGEEEVDENEDELSEE